MQVNELLQLSGVNTPGLLPARRCHMRHDMVEKSAKAAIVSVLGDNAPVPCPRHAIAGSRIAQVEGDLACEIVEPIEGVDFLTDAKVVGQAADGLREKDAPRSRDLEYARLDLP